MADMTPRERVATALDHQEPDRVPTALGGGPYGIIDELYFKLLDVFDLGEPVEQFRTGHNITYLDDRVFERFGVDTRYVWPGASPSSPQTPTDDPEVFVDSYGQPWRQSYPYWYAMEGILAGKDIDDIDALVHWPDPSDPRWMAGVRERARFLKEETDYYVIARMVTSYGPYMTSANLRGTQNFLIDLGLNEDFVAALVERVTDSITGMLKGYMEACGDYVDMVELPGDDYASNTNLIMSPRTFRKFFKPAIRRLVATVKEARSDIKVMLHSDGLIETLLPDFIELGVDAIHPLEPLEALDQTRIKAEYGDKLTFIGGIGITHAMPGTQQDVIDEVKLRISQLAPGGGYILAPANHLQPDVPPENVITLFEAAREYGQYPIT
jgi:uroporphyrinogen decarboxylase